jgi:hypothetical protein
MRYSRGSTYVTGKKLYAAASAALSCSTSNSSSAIWNGRRPRQRCVLTVAAARAASAPAHMLLTLRLSPHQLCGVTSWGRNSHRCCWQCRAQAVRQFQAHLLLQLPLGALQVFYQQVLAGQLLVVWEVVDALPLMQVQLVQLCVDPAAGAGGARAAAAGEAFAAGRLAKAFRSSRL